MSNLWRAALLLLAIPALAACASTRTSPHAHAHSGDWPEATPFDPAANAGGELELAFAVAAAHDAADQGALNILAIFGANWCRDSRALAGWPETPRFRALTDELLWLSIAMPVFRRPAKAAISNWPGILA